MDSSSLSRETSPPGSDSGVGGSGRPSEAIGYSPAPLFSCDYYEVEHVRNIAQALLSGLAAACVESTMGDLFKTPASVAANVRKEMIEYLRQQSEVYPTQYVMIVGNSGSPEIPVDVVGDLLDNFVHDKRNLFTRMSGWLLSEHKEDKVDDFVEELETMGFWVKGRRENLAKDLLKSIDLSNAYHCDMKFDSSEELALHKSKCPLRPVNCANEGCREVFSSLYAKKHDDTCPLKLVPCEQNCSAMVNRSEMDRHCITVCPMKVVNCPFYQVGCLSTIPQSAVEDHCAGFLQSHLFYVLQMLHKQEASVGDLTQRVILLEQSLSLSQRSAAVDIGSLCLIIKEQEAKIKTLEQDVGKLQQNMKTSDVSAEVLQLSREMRSLQKKMDSQSLK